MPIEVNGKSFETDEEGEMRECVGVKLDIDRQKRTMKMTQPVLIQSYKDEFDLPNESRLIHRKGSIDPTFTTLIWFEIETAKPSSICG